MDKKYIQLFKELARSTSVSAEQVMDYDKSKQDEKGFATAQVMRDNYNQLYETINKAGDNYIPTKEEAAKLVVGAIILVNQLQDRINNLKKAVNGYQLDIIPKLRSVVDDAENDEAAAKIAEEKFIIENNE